MTLYIVTRPEINAYDAKPPLVINGVEIQYELDAPCHLDDVAVEALNNTFGLTVTALDDEASEPELAPEPQPDPIISSPASGVGDGAASPDGGAADGSADSTFDPEAVIEGTIPEVTAKLAGLTPEQLALVQAAETDREQPRVGVNKAIAAAIAETKE